MTYEQQLIRAREAILNERKYQSDWDEAIAENYRRIKADHEERRFLLEQGCEL